MATNAFTVCASSETDLRVSVRPHIPVCMSQSREFFVDIQKNGKFFLSVHRQVVVDDCYAREVSLEDTSRPRLIPRQSTEDQTLLYVQSRAGVVCQMTGAPKPHFVECHTWLGADGARLLGMEGNWGNPQKRQLFITAEGQSLLFFDSNAEVTKITAQQSGQAPFLVRANNLEVAEYILSEAKRRGGDNVKARTWAYHALQELGCQGQIDAFQKLYPDFHMRKK